jgi:hypothetical protein
MTTVHCECGQAIRLPCRFPLHCSCGRTHHDECDLDDSAKPSSSSCVHRGGLLGQLDCGCGGKPAVLECAIHGRCMRHASGKPGALKFTPLAGPVERLARDQQPMVCALCPDRVADHIVPVTKFQCLHRGPEIGVLDCDCSQRQEVYTCGRLTVGYCIIVRLRVDDGNRIRLKDGRLLSDVRYTPWRDASSIDAEPQPANQGSLLWIPVCRLCPHRKAS